MKKRPRQVKEIVQCPEYRRPGNIPANDQVNGEKTRIMMKAAMTTLNQLQYALVLLRLTMQCIV